ncbi:MAG: bifunctional homocysteine S-methyltransferase/methylenetetrahydrofolate reductase, partial [Anaerolineaceae bacterium]|nr:bifunctional homocysteine S-methyltransferase/methylenetetrahydrofolate reductase [Anaerolineaceae bacterium]
MDNYDLVPSGLIKLIKQGFNAGLDYAGTDIGQPTTFFAGTALNLNPSDIETEIKNLRRKLKAGADFILTQPVYEPEIARKFFDYYENLHGKLEIPVLVGILPLAKHRHASFLHHEVPGIDIPAATLTRLEKAGDKGLHVGVEIAIELIEELKTFTQGVYIMPAFSRYDVAAEIIEHIKANK